MSKEIKRNYWSRFCKSFNVANQYRPIRLTVTGENIDRELRRPGPFLGLSLTKTGRQVNGLQIITAAPQPDNIAHPLVTLELPSQLEVEQDDLGRDRFLKITADDGVEATLEIMGDRDTDQPRRLVEKVAYFLYEHRGRTHGDDLGDWYIAEQRVHEVEQNFIR